MYYEWNEIIHSIEGTLNINLYVENFRSWVERLLGYSHVGDLQLVTILECRRQI